MVLDTIREWAPRMAVIAFLVAISLCSAGVPSVVVVGLIAVLTGLGLLIAVSDAHRRSEARKYAQLFADADYQHWCIMRGDDRVGTFGTRYQPTPLETP